MKIEPILSDNVELVSNLVWEVFYEFVAPGYSPEGIETFRQFIQPERLAGSVKSGSLFILGCFDEDKLAGVIAIRDFSHISLLFVDKAFHCRGIARELFNKAVGHCLQENHRLKEISVNSSPYARPIYNRIGFKAKGEQTTTDGITYIPMIINIHNFESANAAGEIIRYIRESELNDLLDLYRHLNKDDPRLQENESLTSLWHEILEDPGQHYLAAEVNGRIVSSCVLVVINNLTRGARPYGLIENVVTHDEHRNKGYGTRLLDKALQIARDNGCYKVMLMSSRGEEILRFYENAGFVRGKKTGFVVRF